MLVEFHADHIIKRYRGGFSIAYGLCVKDGNLRKRVDVANKAALAIEADAWRAEIAETAKSLNRAYQLSVTKPYTSKERKFAGFNAVDDALSAEKVNFSAAPYKTHDGEPDSLLASTAS